MPQILSHQKALTRIAVFCLGTSALTLTAPAVARRLKLSLLTTVALLLCASSALAQTTLWGGGTGSWFSVGNWSAGVPGPGSDAQVASGTAQIAASTGTIQSLTISGFSTIDLQTGGALSATNGIFVGDAHTPGTLLLSGSSNLTGPITIGGGTVWSQVNGTLSNNITVDPNMGGFLKVQPGNTLILAGSLSGYPLDVTGGGTAILTGSANAVSIGAGTTFQVGNGGTSGSLGSAVIINGLTLNNGILVYDHSDNVTVPTFITGGGTLVQTGSGTLFVATSSAAGSAIISSGTMAFVGSGSFSSGGSVTDNAIFDISGISSSNFSIGSLSGSGVVVLGNKSLTLLTGGGTFSGTIGGSGGINLSMTGTQIFSGANTYTGSTTIFSGMLQLGPGGNLASTGALAVNGGTFDLNGQTQTVGALSGTSGAITLGLGSLTTNSSTNTSLASAISGGGSLTKAGTGTLTIAATNAYTGGTTISAGTLQLGVGGGLASTGALTINGGTFDLNGQTQTVGALSGTGGAITLGSGSLTTNSSATTSLAAVVSGSGSLTKTGTGTLILTGANSYTGGTTISGGTLQLGTPATGGSISGNVANNSKLQFDRSDTNVFAGNISGAGIVWLAGQGTAILTGTNNYTGDTTVFINATLQAGNGGTSGSLANSAIHVGGGTVTFDRSDSYVFSGSITDALDGTGLTGRVSQTGTGTTILSGINTYSGSTTVSSGVLAVTGSIANSNVSVAGGATLTGTGKVGATTVASGGTLTPGSSTAPGTLSVAGNLTLASAANYFDAVTTTAAGFTSISGTASINGNFTASVAPGAYTFGQRFTVLTTGAGLGGTFAALNGIPAFLKGQLSYDANNAYLTLSPVALAPSLSNGTTNQSSVVAAIDAAVKGGAAPSGGFLTLYSLSGTALNSALDQISGQIGPNVTNAAGQGFLSFLSMTGQGSGDTGSFAPGSAYGAADAPHRAQLAPGAMRIWGAAYGGHVGLSADAASGAASLSASNVGMIGGLDMEVDDGFLLGLTAGIGRQNFTSGNGTGDSGDVMIGAYARKDIGPLTISGAFGYGRHQITTLRVITISGTDVLQGKQDADDFGGRLEAGWHTALDDQYALIPYFAVAADSFRTPAYAETALSGASTFALSYAAHTSTLGRSELGTRLGHKYETENGTLSADVQAAWAHQLDDQPFNQASFQGLPGASFTVAGVRTARDTALLGADLQMQNSSGLFFGVQAQTQLGAGTTIVQGMGNLGWRW